MLSLPQEAACPGLGSSALCIPQSLRPYATLDLMSPMLGVGPEHTRQLLLEGFARVKEGREGKVSGLREGRRRRVRVRGGRRMSQEAGNGRRGDGCLCVFVSVCAFVSVYSCVYSYLCVRVCLCVCMFVYICVCECLSVCLCVPMCV